MIRIQLVLKYRHDGEERLQTRTVSRICLNGKGELLLYRETGKISETLELARIRDLNIQPTEKDAEYWKNRMVV